MILQILFAFILLLLAIAPPALSQTEPKPIVEHLGMLVWAEEVSNFQAVFQQRGWHGWGRDTNDVCPTSQPQVTAANASRCDSGPDAIDARNHSWTGVTCDPFGHVACINLAGTGLSGPLSSLDNLLDGHMMSLLSLDLSHNRFAGELEGAWATAYHLQELHLAGQAADLTGRLPGAWAAPGAFPRLQVLNLAGNQLSGPIPAAWARDPEAADGSAFPRLRTAALLPGNSWLCGPVPEGLPLAVLSNSSAGSSSLGLATGAREQLATSG
ncbi:hypothetical protein WJX81_001570 [Elliptochloris bilobata]|uniref:Uncharacterized protein n=1 Tax=Elliptochloris bilobata TaxID=381761 RepID=A0AAW1RII1_9CHLO